MFCQSKFSHKEMQKKNAQMLHDMLHDVGENWADLNTTQKNGTWIFRDHLGIAGIYMFNNHPKLAFPDLDSMIRERVFLRSKV
jgi:glutathione S-transferase